MNSRHPTRTDRFSKVQVADAESAEGGDTEGHVGRIKFADAESAEGGGDTEGHGMRFNGADAESAEGGDTEGHGGRVKSLNE